MELRRLVFYLVLMSLTLPAISQSPATEVRIDLPRVRGIAVGKIDRLIPVPLRDLCGGGGLTAFAMNVNYKPWDNKLVRQAANYSVDADSIVKNIFEGNGSVLQA